MEKIPSKEDIYAEAKRKRALLGITPDMYSTNKRAKKQINTHRELLISESGGVMYR